MENKTIKIFGRVNGVEMLHGILKGKICCVLPTLSGEEWFPSYYLHCSAVEILQKNKCEILRFKDDKVIVEVKFMKAIGQGFLSPSKEAELITIPKKWGKKGVPKLF